MAGGGRRHPGGGRGDDAGRRWRRPYEIRPARSGAGPSCSAGSRWCRTCRARSSCPTSARSSSPTYHLEKGSAFAARGIFLPPYDSVATLASLARAVLRLAPLRIIALGDGFHDRRAEERPERRQPRHAPAAAEGPRLALGHRQPRPRHQPCTGGEVQATLQLGGVTLRHEPGASERAARSPAICIRPRKSACAAGPCAGAASRSPRRCVLPAMGAYAGELNLRDAAFTPLFEADMTAHMLGDGRHCIDRRLLLPD